MALLTPALVGHPTLRRIELSSKVPDDEAASAAGQLLAALLAANTPALLFLSMSDNPIGDDAARMLLPALTANTHLLGLRLAEDTLSDAFIRNELRPVALAHPSLIFVMVDFWQRELIDVRAGRGEAKQTTYINWFDWVSRFDAANEGAP